jgi:hypothetical protein
MVPPNRGALKMLCVVFETVYEDGGYNMLVQHFGREYAVSYVNAEIRIHGVNKACQRGPSWKHAASRKAIIALVEARLADLGPDFKAKHVALYAEDMSPKAEQRAEASAMGVE